MPILQGSYLVHSGMILEDNPQELAKTLLSPKISYVVQRMHDVGTSTIYDIDMTNVSLPMFLNTVVSIT